MAFVIRPKKYLIEKSRRHLTGVIARVGTGGSVPKQVQAAIDDYARSLAGGKKDSATIYKGERDAIRDGMKRMQGTWLVLSSVGLRWVAPGHGKQAEEDAIKKALRNSGWSVPVEQLRELIG